MNFLNAFRRAPDPLIEVRISREAILTNYRAFCDAYSRPVAPVLKSNAYGHGLAEIADILESEQPPLLVVDSHHEALVLRVRGVRTPILVMGYSRPEMIACNRLRQVVFTLTSLDGIREAASTGSRTAVNIKLDTGMRRQGILPAETDGAIELLKQSRLRVEGICSHFADADGADDAFTDGQIELWNDLVNQWRAAFPGMRYWHIAATAGSHHSNVDANLIRLGTGLYGFNRHRDQKLPLVPTLSLRSILTGIKDLAIGERVGYNGTFTALSAMRIATVPVGYFEGFDRRLSNKGCMLVAGVPCPVLGRVSMNISTIDVSDCPDARLGTPVTVMSDSADDPNSLTALGRLCDTTPLDLLVHIPQHLRRTVV